MTDVVGLLTRIVQNLSPYVTAAFYTGTATDSLLDCAAVELLASYYDVLGLVSAADRATAEKFLFQFLSRVDYLESLEDDLTIDLKYWKKLLNHKNRTRRVPSQKKKSKSLNRLKKEAKLSRKKIVCDSDSESNQDLPPVHHLMDYSEFVSEQVPGNKEATPYFLFSEAQYRAEDCRPLWELRNLCLYNERFRRKPVPLTRSDVVALSLIILHGLTPRNSASKGILVGNCLWDDALKDIGEFRESFYISLSKIVQLQSLLFCDELRQKMDRFSRKEVIEDLGGHLIKMCSTSSWCIDLAIYSDDIRLLSSQLCSHASFLSLLEALCYLSVQSKVGSLDERVMECCSQWYENVVNLSGGANGALVTLFLSDLEQVLEKLTAPSTIPIGVINTLLKVASGEHIGVLLEMFSRKLRVVAIKPELCSLILQIVAPYIRSHYASCKLILTATYYHLRKAKTNGLEIQFEMPASVLSFISNTIAWDILRDNVNLFMKCSELSDEEKPIKQITNCIFMAISKILKFDYDPSELRAVFLVFGKSITSQSTATIARRAIYEESFDVGASISHSIMSQLVDLDQINEVLPAIIAHCHLLSSDEKAKQMNLQTLCSLIEACLPLAERDIWSFLEDGAEKFLNKLLDILYSVETIAGIGTYFWKPELEKVLHRVFSTGIEWMKVPSSKPRIVRRWSELIVSSVASLVMMRGPNSDLAYQIVNKFYDELKNNDFYTQSSALIQALCMSLANHSLSETAKIYSLSELSLEEKIANTIKIQPRMLLAPGLMGACFKILSSAICDSLGTAMEFKLTIRNIRNLLDRVNFIGTSESWIKEGADKLIDLSSSVFNCCAEDDSLDSYEYTEAVIDMTFNLMKKDPQPAHLKKIMILLAGHRMHVECILKRLNEILDRTEPPNVFLFPQEFNQHDAEKIKTVIVDSHGTVLYPCASIPLTSCPVPITDGITISTWIKIVGQTEHPHHVFSVLADDKLRISLNLYPAARKLKLIVREQNTKHLSKFVSGCLKLNVFVHVTLQVKYVPSGKDRGLYAQVCTGSQVLSEVLESVGLDHMPPVARIAAVKGVTDNSDHLQNANCQLLFGATIGPATVAAAPKTAFEMANLFGFKGVIHLSSIFALRALGPCLRTLCETVADRPFPCPAREITRALIHNRDGLYKPYVEDVIAAPHRSMQQLQKSLHFVMRADAPSLYQISCRPSSVDERDPVHQRMIVFRPFQLTTSLISEPRKIFDESFQSCGGLSLFLGLYARFVNDRMPPEAQLLALKALLKFSRRPSMDSEAKQNMLREVLARVIDCENTYFEVEQTSKMVENTLVHENHENLVDILLKFCIDWPPIPYDNQQLFNPHSAVLKDAELLMSLLEQARLWKGERFSYWREIVTHLSHLCGDATCLMFEFNASMLRLANCLPRLLNAFYEMISFPDDYNDFANCDEFAQDVATLAYVLIGDPHNIHSVMFLWNFIFTSHPADGMFIQYARENTHAFSDWIKTDAFARSEHSHAYPKEQTELCKKLQQYYEVLGNDVMIEFGKTGTMLSKVREAFEEVYRDRTLSKAGVSLEEVYATTSSDEDGMQIVIGQPAPEDKKKISIPPPWVNLLRAALATKLSDILEVGSDNLLAGLLHDVVSWQAILALFTNQDDLKMREAASRLLQVFLNRSPIFTKVTFLELLGFPILANQLRGRAVSKPIADAVFSMMCHYSLNIRGGLDEGNIANLDVNRMSCEVFHVIIVVFVESVSDSSLFWEVANSIIKIFDTNLQLQAAMIDCGLVDAMVCILRRLAYKFTSSTGTLVEELASDQISQLECWMKLAAKIVVAAVPFDDTRLYTACKRFVNLLMLADVQSGWELENCTGDLSKKYYGIQLFIRRYLCFVLRRWLDSLKDVFLKEGKSASAPSSQESLYDSDFDQLSEYDQLEDMLSPERAHQMNGTSPMAAFVAGQFNDLREKLSKLGGFSKQNLKCKYRKNRGPVPLALMEELGNRLIFAFESIANIYVVFDLVHIETTEEGDLLNQYLFVLLGAFGKDTIDRGLLWTNVSSSAKSRAKKIFAQLSAFLLYPAKEKHQQWMMVHGYDENSVARHSTDWQFQKRIWLLKSLVFQMQKYGLKEVLRLSMDDAYTICLGVFDMAFLSIDPGDEVLRLVDEIYNHVRSLNEKTPFDWLNDSPRDVLKAVSDNEMLGAFAYDEYLSKTRDKLQQLANDILAEAWMAKKQISEMAMKLTPEIGAQVSQPRKSFLEETRILIRKMHCAEDHLTNIMHELCHPLATLYLRSFWPVGWQLDPTEGPSRERRRMMPGNYDFNSRFFQKDEREKIEQFQKQRPFDSIIKSSEYARRRDELAIADAFLLSSDVIELRGTVEVEGDLIVAKHHLHMLPRQARTTHKGVLVQAEGFFIEYSHILEIYMRNYLLKAVSIEIFVRNGATRSIVFSTEDKREEFVRQLTTIGFGSLFVSYSQVLGAICEQWRHGTITNFEYLMQLNKLAGRSYNDFMQYPVFPFVLANYSSPFLDLGEAESFRNLSKPMPIQNKAKEAHYINNYKCLEAEEKMKSDLLPYSFGAYHYGSHYSNSGVVAHYLVRLNPFTQVALEYQDNSFDIADRLFSSMEAIWRLSSSESTSDFKEMIPEFYYMYEFLQNRHRLNLGVRQNGERVEDVRLPNWVPHNNPRLFTILHRQALESGHVTANIHFWIDLIFGYKQTGKAAKEAINVFHPATYVGKLDIDGETDAVSQNALRTMVRTYGQMPTQLFQSPHQPHLLASQLLVKQETTTPAPFPSVANIRWGDYVGSPTHGHIRETIWARTPTAKGERLATLVTLPDGKVAGCPAFMQIVSKNDDEATEGALSTNANNRATRSDVVGIFSYDPSHPGIIRFRLLMPDSNLWINAIDCGLLQPSCTTYSVANDLLFIGYSCGVICVYGVKFDKTGLISVQHKGNLIAHGGPITTLSVCDEYSVLASGCCYGKVILWDTNDFRFIRILRDGENAVSATCISTVSGDIAVVSQRNKVSKLELYSINGDLVADLNADTILTCAVMTNQPEGTAVNCVAVGTIDGRVRMVDTWRLSTVNEVELRSKDAIIDLQFANNSRRLYVAQQNARVLCLQSDAQDKLKKPATFRMINPHS